MNCTVHNEENHLHYVEFEIITALVMRRTIFLGITLCSRLKAKVVSDNCVPSIFRVED
jgi:hypothetical protein